MKLIRYNLDGVTIDGVNVVVELPEVIFTPTYSGVLQTINKNQTMFYDLLRRYLSGELYWQSRLGPPVKYGDVLTESLVSGIELHWEGLKCEDSDRKVVLYYLELTRRGYYYDSTDTSSTEEDEIDLYDILEL